MWRPLQPGDQEVGRRRLSPLIRSPKEVGFRRPGSGMLERRGCLPPSLGELREREATSLSHPARPRGPTSPQAEAHSPSAPRFPAVRPRHLLQPHAPGDPCSRPPRPYRSAPRPRQRGPDTGRWTSRRKVSSEERGGTGRGGAGRGRRGGKGPAEEGERGERGLRGVCSPAGNGWGDRFQGPPPGY